MNEYPAKRAIDLLVAGTVCVVLAPLGAGVAAAVWLQDHRPVFYTQPRVGRVRRAFRILKFRSMREGRVTRVGEWLRRTGIDELPQFVNVLCGEMSVVGPRPLTQADIDRLGWSGHRHDWRFDAKPGITGLSQLMAGRGARASETFDRLYLRRQSALLDLQLIALSAAVNVFGKRTVRHWLRAVHPFSSGETPR